jgi:hypothetical protein
MRNKGNMLFIITGMLLVGSGVWSMEVCAQKRGVEYSTQTKVFYAVPSCISKDEFNDLNLESMISEEPLTEHTKLLIDEDNHLTITVLMGKMIRFFNKGKIA